MTHLPGECSCSFRRAEEEEEDQDSTSAECLVNVPPASSCAASSSTGPASAPSPPALPVAAAAAFAATFWRGLARFTMIRGGRYSCGLITDAGRESSRLCADRVEVSASAELKMHRTAASQASAAWQPGEDEPQLFIRVFLIPPSDQTSWRGSITQSVNGSNASRRVQIFLFKNT